MTAATIFKTTVLLVLLVVGQVVIVCLATDQQSAVSSESLPTCDNDDLKPPQTDGNTSSSSSSSSTYRHLDDASWAIVSPALSRPHTQALYDDFIAGCKVAAGDEITAISVCMTDEANRMQMNANQPAAMQNFTQHGFLKTRAPAEVMTLLQDFFNRHSSEATEEWEHLTPYHNSWVAPPTILRLEHAAQYGYGGSSDSEETYLPNMISRHVQNTMQEWTGQALRLTSVYGIRLYHNQSILTPHVDRLPLISSAIINVAQDVEEDWPLEVYDHDGVAHNVTMQPGDMVLYESHSVIHGRPFPLNGKFFANVFVHFEPLGSLDEQHDHEDEHDDEHSESDEDDAEQSSDDDEDEQNGDEEPTEEHEEEDAHGDDEDDLPYYITPGTAWAQAWMAQRNRG
jgi:hypothetical protein